MYNMSDWALCESADLVFFAGRRCGHGGHMSVSWLRRALIGPSPLSASKGLLGALRARPIITVEVNQPAERLVSRDDHGAQNAMQAEVQRAEEMAMSQFHRLVQDEINRGTLKPRQRGMKRFARYMQPCLAARDAARLVLWRKHKKTTEMYMNWIQYRRRRSLA